MDEIYYNGDIITLEKELYKEAIHIKDGKIYRGGKNGIEYPPISREEYKRIQKEREESREDRDEGMTH